MKNRNNSFSMKACTWYPVVLHIAKTYNKQHEPNFKNIADNTYINKCLRVTFIVLQWESTSMVEERCR
jgi:hypothetical protein